jgi:oligopeptidase B
VVGVASRPPAGKVIDSISEFHGDARTDPFAWLRRDDDPDTLLFLRENNAYADRMTAHLAPLRDRIQEELKARIVDADMSVPIRKGGWWYYGRSEPGAEHGIRCRVPAVDDRPPEPGRDDEQILLDENTLAAGLGHYALGVYDVSPDGRLLAYGVDARGDERFDIGFVDLEAGGSPVRAGITGAYYGGAWDAAGENYFYTTVDGVGRPCQVWRYNLATAYATEVYTEPDDRFWVTADLSRSERFVFIESHSPTTSEVRFVPATAPATPPRLFGHPRSDGVELLVEHQGDRFLVLHNTDAPNFVLSAAPVDDTAAWSTLLSHDPDTRLLTVDAFRDHVVVQTRSAGRRGITVLDHDGNRTGLPFADAVHTAHLTGNPTYATRHLRVAYSSMATPPAIMDYDLDTGEFAVRKRTTVPGFDPARYRQSREWAQAPDGTPVPMSILCRTDLPRDATAPGVLEVYGAYEHAVDADFDLSRFSLVDRGAVYAIAHVRGGGELGPAWHQSGRRLAKRNGITDLLACAARLAEAGWTAPGRLVALGASAGGLLVGAAANTAPHAFAGIVADVPFVDPLNTLLDPSLPLTVTDWDELGNPLADADVYAYIKSYSPYENVRQARYPAILALASHHDARVGYHEPAKWIAKLRHLASGGPFLLRTDLSAGHGGRSGRYEALRDLSFTLAWVLDAAGAAA